MKDHHIVVYPDVIRGGKKSAFFGVIISIFALIGSFWIAMTPGRDDTLQMIGLILFSTLMLFTFMTQLLWGPLLSINEQLISLRPNPFLKRIEVQWNEIDAFIPFTGRNHFFLEVTLAPTHREAFLLRQSPFMRKLLAKRLTHSGRIARFSQLYLPCAQSDLLGVIDEIYYAQISMNRITLDKLW